MNPSPYATTGLVAGNNNRRSTKLAMSSSSSDDDEYPRAREQVSENDRSSFSTHQQLPSASSSLARPSSSERRLETTHNLTLAAGRRKLEEFKRKKAKAAALAKSAKNALTDEAKLARLDARLDEAVAEADGLRAEAAAVEARWAERMEEVEGREREKVREAREEVDALRARVEELETASGSGGQGGEDRYARMMEERAEERSVMEREKAALLGEVVGLRSTVAGLEEALEEAKTKSENGLFPGIDDAERNRVLQLEQAMDLLREEIGVMAGRAEGLERALGERERACELLATEKDELEARVRELTVKLAVPATAATVQAAEARVDALEAELEGVRAALQAAESTAREREGAGKGQAAREAAAREAAAREAAERAYQDQVFECQRVQALLADATAREEDAMYELEESKENIESLRELLAEGEAERVELVAAMAALKAQADAAAGARSVDDGAMQQQQQQQLQQRVHELEGELQMARLEVTEWRDRAEKAAADAEVRGASAYRASLDFSSHANANSSSPSEAALRVRLAKAEAAVETERQAYYSLEQKSRQWQVALDENASLRHRVTELREKEREMESAIAELQRSSGSRDGVSDVSRQPETQAELDASAANGADDAYWHGNANANANAIANANANANGNSHETALFDRLDQHHREPQPVPPPFPSQEPETAEQAASLFDLIDQGPQEELDPEPIATAAGAVPVAMGPPPPPMAFPDVPPMPAIPAPESPAYPQSHPTEQPHQSPGYPPQQEDEPPALMPWAIPGGDASPPPKTATPTRTPPSHHNQHANQHLIQQPQAKKSVGFWGWIAGADRVIEGDE